MERHPRDHVALIISFPNFEWGEQERLIEHLLDVLIEGVLST